MAPVVSPSISVTPVQAAHSLLDLSGDSDGVIRVPAPSLPLAARNELLSQVAQDSLEPTTISRDRWVLGYDRRICRAPAEVAPWDAATLAQTSVAELSVAQLVRHLSRPDYYIFPPVSKAPLDSQWLPGLIVERHIQMLYSEEPWLALSTRVEPISFPNTGWYAEMAQRYRLLASDHIQAIWESLHQLPIAVDQRPPGSFLQRYWTGRKQRRSRYGARWKTFLAFVLRGIIDGHCDLDIFLDPFFLHCPRQREKRAWYPGLIGASDDLCGDLEVVDVVEPWRNQFRADITAHPGSSLPRLSAKFFSQSAEM